MPNKSMEELLPDPQSIADNPQTHKHILSLCDYSGNWPQPYLEAGYNVIQVDLAYGWDVLELAQNTDVLPSIHGVLAAPPCDHFASSGARWWKQKDADGRTEQGLQIVDACLSIIDQVNPVWWALENPIGRLPSLRPNTLGTPGFYFDPCDYGDPYTKRTCLWGSFIAPLPLFTGGDEWVFPADRSKMHRMSSSWKRQRSTTPVGFARAFYRANP